MVKIVAEIPERFSVTCPNEDCTQDIDIIELLEGDLKCPNCKHKYEIQLHDDGVNCDRCDDEENGEAYRAEEQRQREKDEPLEPAYFGPPDPDVILGPF